MVVCRSQSLGPHPHLRWPQPRRHRPLCRLLHPAACSLAPAKKVRNLVSVISSCLLPKIRVVSADRASSDSRKGVQNPWTTEQCSRHRQGHCWKECGVRTQAGRSILLSPSTLVLQAGSTLNGRLCSGGGRSRLTTAVWGHAAIPHHIVALSSHVCVDLTVVAACCCISSLPYLSPTIQQWLYILANR